MTTNPQTRFERDLGRAHRPVGPFGLFRTGPHRTLRQVWEDYRDILRDWTLINLATRRKGPRR